jgi:HEAT repeat protein
MNRNRYIILIIALLISSLCYATEREEPLSDRISRLLSNLPSRNWEVIADELIKIGNPSIKPLIDALRDESRGHWINERAAWILRAFNTEEIEDLLIKTLGDKTKHIRIRTSCAESLGFMKSEKSVDTLFACAKERPIGLRYFSVSALGEIGSKRAEEKLLEILNTDTFEAGCRSNECLQSEKKRLYVVKALTKASSAQATKALIELLSSRFPEISRKSAEELVNIGGRSVPFLKKHLRSDNSTARFYCIWALGKIQPNRNIELFLSSLKDDDWKVQNEAAAVLIRMENKLPDEEITSLILHKNYAVREITALIIGETNKFKYVPQLIDGLKDDYSGWAAAIALGKLKSKQAIPPLLNTMQSKNLRLRRTAAWALWNIGLDNPIKILAPFGDDPDEEVTYWIRKTMK